jgi:isocitrate dehydrogenase
MSTQSKPTFNGIVEPDGEVIKVVDGKTVTPYFPIIPYIEGDGIGPELTNANWQVMDAAVRTAYGESRRIQRYEVFAGDKALAKFGEVLPADTLAAIKHYGVALKGPLSTPTGGGMRSLNVYLRKTFDLYSCVRPVRYFQGVVSVVKRPQDLDIVIFRENIEDVYAGPEFEMGSRVALRIIDLLKEEGYEIRADSGVGIKAMSRFGSRRLVKAAIAYAINAGRKIVTIVHKGNIMKYTEGAFLKWGLEIAAEEFGDIVVSEAELWSKHAGKLPEGKILLNHRIADATFAELLLKPKQFSVIATMNLNGDYLSDATAAQEGGLGLAPGGNIGDGIALFEATGGSALDIAGKGISNPCSLLLSSVMMLEYLGWTEAAAIATKAMEKTIRQKTVTNDLARFMRNGHALNTKDFASAICSNMTKARRRAANK